MDFFYQQLSESYSLATAVQQAQKRLRTLTTNEVLERLDNVLRERGLHVEAVKSDRKYISENFEADECPYSDPFYGAAFCVLGSDLSTKSFVDPQSQK